MDQENTPWRYKSDAGNAADQSAGPGNQASPRERQTSKSFAWEATEFIEHNHGTGWYSALAFITAGLAALAYFLAKDMVGVVIVVMVGIIVGVFAGQKPGRAKYEIMQSGLNINGKVYYFSGYKSFAVMREGDLSSIYLLPLKRFIPPLSAYFDPKDEKKIMDTLGNYLPYEDRKLDMVEQLFHRLRL